MTRTDALAPAAPLSNPAAAPPKHIVDVLIEERAQRVSGWLLRSRATGPFLKRVFRYDEARLLADQLGHLTGEQAFDELSSRLELRLETEGFDQIPHDGPTIIVANHPTGLADGIAIWRTVRKVRKDVVFLANADALRVAPRFDDIIIPIEWRIGERTPSKSRTALVRSQQELAAGKCVIIFPSGIPAVPTPLLIEEQPWLPTFAALATKARAPLIPVAMRARNSALFYAFCILNKPLRHMSLFREFVNKRGAEFKLRVLNPRVLNERPADIQTYARELQREVVRAAAGL